MPLTKTEKSQMVARYQESLAAAPHVFLVQYKGINVPDDTELRSRLRAAGASYEVVRNRLARLAIRGKPLESLKDAFSGPVAVAYTDHDVVALAKALSEFAKSVPSLEVKAGIVEGQPVAAEQIAEIATLPSREELIAKLLFLLQSPVTRLARTLKAITRDFVVVMGQVAEQKSREQN